MSGLPDRPPCGHYSPVCGVAICDRAVRAERAAPDRWTDPVTYQADQNVNYRQIGQLIHQREYTFHQVAAWFNVPTWLIVGLALNPVTSAKTLHATVEQAEEMLYSFRNEEPAWAIADRLGIDDETVIAFRSRLRFASNPDRSKIHRPRPSTSRTSLYADA